MKHKRILNYSVFLLLLSVLLISVFGNIITSNASSAKLNKKSATLWVGDSLRLSVKKTDEKVKWSSDNKSVATVSSKGEVKAKKDGKAVITAKVGKAKLKCKVTVVSGESKELTENGIYTSKEKVALYIHTYKKLPSNFITKEEAQSLGWPGGSLQPYAPNKCIGGNKFSNYEGNLPKETGRQYYECDINTLGGSQRGAERLVYSNDGLIYYTPDHYETFVLLYE